MDWQNFSTELELGITTHCQAACPFCVRTHIADSLHLMHLKLNDVKNFFEDLPNAIQTIRVCGHLGDPLMNPHLDDILDFLVFDKKLNFRLHTNGGIRNEQWFKDKWVRFGPDGKIRGDCARGSSKEGKPKCLPRSKAHALGKKGRKKAASRKRRKDPSKNRKGKAINVRTK